MTCIGDVCERCNGRGVIETGTLSKGPGGYGYDTVPCGCEERAAFREAADEVGWLIELETFDSDEGALSTAWAQEGSYKLGPEIRREQVPAGAVYRTGSSSKLWLNDEPSLMGPQDDSETPIWFRVATLAPPVEAQDRRGE